MGKFNETTKQYTHIMELPLYEIFIDNDVDSELLVDAIALVDRPAIKRTFNKFSEDFVEPSKGERQDSFIPRCIEYIIKEGKSPDQAAAICHSMWEQHFAGQKVSFDYDETLSTERGMALAKRHIDDGDVVYIISARGDKEPMMSRANELGIPELRIYATGSNSAKIDKVKELGIDKHYDNNADVISQLGSIGAKFALNFAINDIDKRIISGPLMVANEPIYRKDPEHGEYMVYFSPDTIKQIAIKLAKKGFHQNVNLMHNDGMKLDGVTLFEVFQSDKERGVLPMKGFEDLPDGSLFGSMYVENDEAWDLIKQGFVRGFSVEGNFGMKLQTKYDAVFAEIVEILNSTEI